VARSDQQALALCVITALAALKPEHRAPYYLKFTQVLREQAAPLLSDEQDPDEWLDRESRVH
jgi:hypothetical protein